MIKTLIIVAIVVVVVAYLWNNCSQTSNKAEGFGSPAPVPDAQIQPVADDTGACVDIADDVAVIDDSVVELEVPSAEAEEKLKKKFRTRNHPRDGKYKHDSYSQGKRGGSQDQAMDYLDDSNDLMQSGYRTNDEFVGADETNGQYAPYAPERKKTDKYKTSEIFNSQNYLPSEKSANPDWFEVVPEPISVKNRHLINVSKPIGINTIGTSLRNPSWDIRGSPPCPKFVISPWLCSTIEPDTNIKPLC